MLKQKLKVFSIISFFFTLIFTDKVEVVSYETLDPNYEWLGANSSNFPLGFLNHAKFNIYELRRDWLPFKMNLFKKLDEDTTQLEINYIGEVTVKFSDGTSGFGIPTRYWNENTVIIDVPEGATHVTVKYSYIKWKIEQIPTLKSGYPYEKFAKLNIIEKGSSKSHQILYAKQTRNIYTLESIKIHLHHLEDHLLQVLI